MLPNYLAPYKENDLIRLGDQKDGGYIISKKILDRCKNIISFGLGLNWSFEEEFFTKNKKINIFCYDHTINKKKFLSKFLIDGISSLKNFQKPKDLLIYLKYKNFFKKSKIHIPKRIVPNFLNNVYPNTECIENITTNKQDILLKIDIEGDEYRLFEDIINIQNKICALIIELHNIDLHKNKIQEFISKLSSQKLIHTHGVNFGDIDKHKDPTIVELTFMHNSLCKKEKIKNYNLPIKGLDFPNKENRDDVKLFFDVS